MPNTNFSVAFMGVVGSSAIGNKQRARCGANTSCVLVKIDGKRPIIIDMGTGLARITGVNDADILLSHFHYDHIEGMPFFSQFFVGGEFNIYSRPLKGVDVKTALTNFIREPYLPITMDFFKANINFHNICEEKFVTAGGTNVESIALDHPGGSTGYKISQGEKKLVYLCDNDRVDQKIIDFCKHADLIIFDSFFTEEQYSSGKFKGWGHSHHMAGLELLKSSDAKKIAFTHHAPSRTDDELFHIAMNVRKHSPDSFVAIDDMIVNL